MSLIPELIFQVAISRGIKLLKEDPRYIDQLFRNLTRGDQDQMRDFVQTAQISLTLNYPREPLSLPAIVILLRSDNEASDGAYLDDFKEYGPADEFAYEGTIEGEVLGGTASTSTTSGLGVLVFGPHRVLSATNNTITVSDGTFYTSQFLDGYEKLKIHIVAGLGAGQQREIVANGTNSIMVGENWTTVPDSTSVFEVRNPAEEVLGTPALLYNRRGGEIIERKGGRYANKYQIQVAASNQEQVIYLYSILKSIFTLSRLFLEKNGIINFKMSGTDFVSRPEYLPDFSYMRQLSVEFDTPFDVYMPVGNLIDAFTLCLIEGFEGDNAKISEAEVDITPATATVTGP